MTFRRKGDVTLWAMKFSLPRSLIETRALPAYARPEILETDLARMALDLARWGARDASGLARLIALIDGLEESHGAAMPLIAARLVAACARTREESRGAHHRADFPALAAEPRRTFIRLADLGARPARIAAE